MSMSRVLVIGSGGHAKVVADILRCQGSTVVGFLDDNPETWGSKRLGLPVLGGLETYTDHMPDALIVGVGAADIRRRIVERLGIAAEPLWCNAVHPSATIASSARLGRGVVVAAGAVINPDAVAGDHVIINTGATVDHDCHVGNYSQIAPGAHLAGAVRVGQGVLVAMGAIVVPGRTIGDGAVVGAGAVVVRDVPQGVKALGVPARW